MNIKDFLIDNYIWILVVILLSIVTIIGFLADKKRVKGKKEELSANNGNDAVATAIPDNLNNPVNTGVNYQANSNQQFDSLNMPLPQANINMQPTAPVEPVQAFNSQMVNTMPSPIEPVNTLPNPEPMYQPLSEQVPNFKNNEPAPNQIPYQNPAQPIPVMPSTPEQPEPVQQTNFINQPSYNNQFNQNNQMNMVPNNNVVNNMNNNNNNIINNNQGINNMSTPSQMPYPNQQANTIPTPIPSPMPVEPTHINNPEPAAPMQNQPISFVYGPQNNQNNNQNM